MESLPPQRECGSRKRQSRQSSFRLLDLLFIFSCAGKPLYRCLPSFIRMIRVRQANSVGFLPRTGGNAICGDSTNQNPSLNQRFRDGAACRKSGKATFSREIRPGCAQEQSAYSGLLPHLRADKCFLRRTRRRRKRIFISFAPAGANSARLFRQSEPVSKSKI